MQPTPPQAIAALLPLLATMVSSWLSQDRLPRFANALIALVALVMTALVCAVLAGNFTGNQQASLLAILGYVAILMHGDLHVLYQFLVAAPGPLAAALAPPPPLAAPPAPTAKTPPQPISFPSSPQPPQGGSVIRVPPSSGG